MKVFLALVVALGGLMFFAGGSMLCPLNERDKIAISYIALGTTFIILALSNLFEEY